MRTNLTTCLLWFLVLSLPASSGGGATKDDTESTPPQFFFEFANLFDFQYTVERRRYSIGSDREKQDEPYPLESEYHLRMEETEGIVSLDQLLVKARKQFPEVLFVHDEKDPKLIHLIDATLKNRDGYVMNRKVDVSYSGELPGLIEAMGIGELQFGTLGGFQNAWNDHVTKVSVKLKNRSARDVLTNALSRARYSRMLWRASTMEKEKITIVQFCGPRDEDDEM